MAKTKTTVQTGTLASVRRIGPRLEFCLSVPVGVRGTPATHRYRFLLSEAKAMRIADDRDKFPLGETLKVRGRIPQTTMFRLNHVNIIAVGGIEVGAWEQRIKTAGVSAAAKRRVAKAKQAEEAVDATMADRAPPKPVGAITDPKKALETAMAIVRRQMKLKNPKLSKQEIWRLRDVLNLFGEKLGIA